MSHSLSYQEDRAFRVALGAELAMRRQALGLTQRVLARRAQMSQPSLSKYELGEREISLTQTLRLAAALRVPLFDLLGAVRGRLESQQEMSAAPAVEEGRRAA